MLCLVPDTFPADTRISCEATVSHRRCRLLSRYDARAVLLTTVGTGQTKWEFKRSIFGSRGREDQMITDTFDRRTLARMEVALERACLLLPTGSEKHNARRIIASKIIECANLGDATLSRLTETGYATAMQLSASAQSVRKKEAAN